MKPPWQLPWILYDKHEAANLDNLVKKPKNLNATQIKELLLLLCKYKDIFDGTLGEFNNPPVQIDLKECAHYVHVRDFPVPHAHNETLFK